MRLILACFTVLVPLAAQHTLAPRDHWNPQLNLAPAVRPLRAFAAAGDAAVTGFSVTPLPTVQFVAIEGGAAVPLPVQVPLNQPVVAARGLWLLTLYPGAPGGEPRQFILRHLQSGTEHRLPASSGFLAAALSDNRAAILEPAPTGGLLRIYRLPDAWLETELAVSRHPADVFLSFASDHRLLLVGKSDYRVTPVLLSTQPGAAREEPVRELSGPEVTDSRRKSNPTFGLGTISTSSPNRGKYTTLAHLTTRAGNDLFLFTPAHPADGLRLVEFNADGEETATHVIKFPDRDAARSATLRLGPIQVIAAGQEDILIPSRDGRVWRFARP